jgi:hypothetical protein
MINVTCPQDGEVYHADVAHIGKHIRCKKCGALLPILGGRGTIVQASPDVNGVRKSQPQAKDRSVPPGPRRTVGITVVVAVIAVGVLILWWYSSTHEGTSPMLRSQTGASPTSPQAEGARPEPSANPAGLPVLSEGPQGTGSEVCLAMSRNSPSTVRCQAAAGSSQTLVQPGMARWRCKTGPATTQCYLFTILPPMRESERSTYRPGVPF